MKYLNIRIALLLSALVFTGLMWAQYVLVSNTYRLNNKEFIFDYKNDLYDAYETCIQGGVFYNGAATLLDTLALKFKKASHNVCDRNDRILLEDLFLDEVITQLRIYNDLDAFLRIIRRK